MKFKIVLLSVLPVIIAIGIAVALDRSEVADAPQHGPIGSRAPVVAADVAIDSANQGPEKRALVEPKPDVVYETDNARIVENELASEPAVK